MSAREPGKYTMYNEVYESYEDVHAKGFVHSLALMVLIMLSDLVPAYVGLQLYLWFAVQTFSLPVLGVADALGIVLLISVMNLCMTGRPKVIPGQMIMKTSVFFFSKTLSALFLYAIGYGIKTFLI